LESSGLTLLLIMATCIVTSLCCIFTLYPPAASGLCEKDHIFCSVPLCSGVLVYD